MQKKPIFLLVSRINENDLFKDDWRSKKKGQVLQYTFLKWFQALLVGLLTGIIATLINLAVENIAGYKLLVVFHYVQKKRFVIDFHSTKYQTVKWTGRKGSGQNGYVGLG